MSTTYRCTKLNIAELFDTFYVGRNIERELMKNHSFDNEFGNIKIDYDGFQDAYYITINLKNNSDNHILPYLSLIDELSCSCLSTTNRFINDNKYTYVYKSENDLIRCLKNTYVFIPTLIIKNI